MCRRLVCRRRLLIISQINDVLNSFLRQILLFFYSITKLLTISIYISYIRYVLLYPIIHNNGFSEYYIPSKGSGDCIKFGISLIGTLI